MKPNAINNPVTSKPTPSGIGNAVINQFDRPQWGRTPGLQRDPNP
jgi:hypothetical protein